MRSKLAKKNFMDKARDLSLQHLQPFIEGLRKEVMSEIPADDPKLTKMFVDFENKIYNIMKKLHDEATLMRVKDAEASKPKTSAYSSFWKNKRAKMALATHLKQKRALDAVNEELGKPTYEPRKDFDRNDSPFFSRGLEENHVMPDPPTTAAFATMPKKFEGTLKELCAVAIKNGYARAIGGGSRINFRKRIKDSDYDYDIEYKKDGPFWVMVGGEVRVKYEYAPDIDAFARKLKSAEIQQHKRPDLLPPREDLKTHMDQDIKDEIRYDPDTKKESSKRLPMFMGRK
jgi:hypothetical protein